MKLTLSLLCSFVSLCPVIWTMGIRLLFWSLMLFQGWIWAQCGGAEWVIPSQELFSSYSSVFSKFFLLFLLKYLLMYYLFYRVKMDKTQNMRKNKDRILLKLSENWHWFWKSQETLVDLFSLLLSQFTWFTYNSAAENIRASLRKHYFIEGLKKWRKRFPLTKYAWYQPSSFHVIKFLQYMIVMPTETKESKLFFQRTFTFSSICPSSECSLWIF